MEEAVVDPGLEKKKRFSLFLTRAHSASAKKENLSTFFDTRWCFNVLLQRRRKEGERRRRRRKRERFHLCDDVEESPASPNLGRHYQSSSSSSSLSMHDAPSLAIGANVTVAPDCAIVFLEVGLGVVVV